MLTYALVALAIIIIGFLVVVSVQPSTFRIARTVDINASPSVIFPHINNLHNMQVWSPWEKMDAEMERTYEGPAAGPGAIYRWNGNNKIGAGSMTIVESRPDKLVGIKLDFIRPFKCSNDVEFSLVPGGESTQVTWAMSGKNKFINKAMCLFFSMDKMCGTQFEQGLQSLKEIAEGTQTTTGHSVETLSGTSVQPVV